MKDNNKNINESLEKTGVFTDIMSRSERKKYKSMIEKEMLDNNIDKNQKSKNHINNDFNEKFDKDNNNNKKSKVKLPAVVKKQDILSKIEGWFANFRENREKTKYLDDTIRSTVITQTEVTPSSKSIFQEELQREITEKAISHEQAPLPNTPEQEMSNFNIGG